MAEALLNHCCGGEILAESAGLEPGALNLLAVAAMANMEIDISKKQPHGIFHLFKSGRFLLPSSRFTTKPMPAMPRFPDPSNLTRTWLQRLEKTIEVAREPWEACGKESKSFAPYVSYLCKPGVATFQLKKGS